MNKENTIDNPNDGQVPLDIALTLLEISDVASIKEADLPKIRKRAMRRWHPDRIAYTNPSPELVAEYETNFKNIDGSVEAVERFLNGDMGSAFNKRGSDREETIQPEEAIRKYATENQQSIRELWPEVETSSFELSEEEVILTEGVPLNEALDEDLKDRVPGLAVFSLGAGFLIMIPAIIFALLVGIFSETIGLILVWVVLVGWFVHALACITFLLPLSRFWLPQPISDSVINIVNATLDATRGWVDDEEGLGKFLYGALGFVSFLVHWLIAVPLYKLGGLLFKSKVIGRNAIKVRYFGGFSDDYVSYLVSKDTNEMSLDELFDLSSMSSKFAQVREH